MEPTSNSGSADPADGTATADASGGETYVCKVCHGRIPPGADEQCLDDLVHRECRAELRCGVSIRR